MNWEEYYGTVQCFHEELELDLLIYGEHFHDQYGERIPPQVVHAARRAELNENNSSSS